MANAEDLQIAGYYSAAENFNDNTVHNAPGKKIADKIAEGLSSACFVVVRIDLKQLNIINNDFSM